ncbi:hypothetical protein, partial [Streptomyces sp. NPDC094144]|uniref:hypothetical protein n=1 Tax=Streptomyces sp. NPDC094144 TaxID=3366056 RepID=UPI00382A6DA1
MTVVTVSVEPIVTSAGIAGMTKTPPGRRRSNVRPVVAFGERLVGVPRPDARPERASSGAGSRCGDDPVPELDGVVPKV